MPPDDETTNDGKARIRGEIVPIDPQPVESVPVVPEDGVTYFHKVATAQRSGPASESGATTALPAQDGPGGAKTPLSAPPGSPPGPAAPAARVAPAASEAPPRTEAEPAKPAATGGPPTGPNAGSARPRQTAPASGPATAEPASKPPAPPPAQPPAPAARANGGGRPAPSAPGRGDLLGDISALRGKWPEIQRGFIDDPRTAVVKAADLTGELADRLRKAIKQREQEIRGEWDGQQHPDTESLRKTLLLYREFLHNLAGR